MPKLPGAGGVTGAQIEEVGFEKGLALDHQRVASVGKTDGMRARSRYLAGTR
jgi:hypothetical protein